ncbi:MAG TPA: LysR substrate-binding domain-containing protein [Salinisphaeraceae bacterium]|nr:LysR substrate-binding domain-containing protein [Salinisphaeraceae bacterium]
MQDLNDLAYFVHVVDHGGFAPAGRATGIPKSKLSRRVAALEKSLGVQLLRRTTRSISVTQIGQRYHAHCTAMLAEAEAAQEAIEQTLAEPRGLIRLSCPPALLYFGVAARLAQFMAQCPRVRIHLEATNRRVDLVREGFDLALRVRFPPIEDSELHARLLTRSPQRLMAAPALFERHPQPQTPSDLPALPTLDWDRTNDDYSWRLDGPDGVVTQIEHAPRLVTDDMVTLRRAALQGLGVVQLPLLVGGDDLAAGRLVEVLPGWAPRSGEWQAVFPERRGLLPSVRALIDFLVDSYGDVDFQSVKTWLDYASVSATPK